MDEKKATKKYFGHTVGTYLVRSIIIALFIIVCLIIHGKILDRAENITRTKWIARCEETRKQERACRIEKEKQDFQKALANSIIKLQPKIDKQLVNRIAFEIITECTNKDLDPILTTALIWIESRFDVLAHGSKGEVGLMQVRYKVWKEDPILQDNGVDAKSKLYWINLNIKCGTKIFAKYYEESEYDIVRTLYKYNSGSKNLPEGKKFYEIEYANKIVLTAYKIKESIKKDKDAKVLEHKID